MEEEREAPSAGNRTRTLACPYVYAKLSASFVGAAPGATEALFRGMINAALRELFGAIGGAVPLDVLQLSEAEGVGIVRVAAPDFGRLQAALTCMTEYDGHECRLQLLASSPFLSSLAADSRRFALDLNLD